jgi:serine/threonine-protein kinase RsbW
MVRARVELNNDLQELSKLESFLNGLSDLGGMDERTIFHLNLVCDELVTNTILYGYKEGEEGQRMIRIEAIVSPEWLELRITDDAAAFDPLERPMPDLTLSIDEREIGGLGIHFVRQVMDEVSYEHLDGLNVLHMKKRRIEL